MFIVCIVYSPDEDLLYERFFFWFCLIFVLMTVRMTVVVVRSTIVQDGERRDRGFYMYL